MALVAGALLVWRLWPARAKPAALLAALALPAGLALTSTVYFLWLVVSGGRAAWYPAVELAVLAAAVLVLRRPRAARRARLVLPARPPPLEALALLVLALTAGVALLVTLRWAAVTPWGYWDAFARINLKSRFLYGGGEHWTWMFRSEAAAQPDYPLLLECSLARLWRWSGGIDPLPAQALSMLGWVGCLAALAALAGHLRSSAVAAAAGLLFLCQRSDRAWAAMQYADFALATYTTLVAGLLALAAADRRRAARWFPLLGVFAGSAAWCKNEGLVFALLALAWTALAHRDVPRRGRAAAGLARGLFLGGLAVPVLKLGFAGKSFVFAARTRSAWEDLLDPARYRIVGGYLARHLAAEMAGWALLLLVAAVVLVPAGRRRGRAWAPLVLGCGMALVFLLVLVTTHFDLDWLTGTTIDRFVLQLWPLAILGLVAAVGSASRIPGPPPSVS